MRILISTDKFKGTLTATAVARAIQAGWRESRPKDDVAIFPISDGGDGFGELLGTAVGAKKKIVTTLNAAHEKVKSAIYLTSKFAIIEAAQSNGLAILPRNKFHPFQLD